MGVDLSGFPAVLAACAAALFRRSRTPVFRPGVAAFLGRGGASAKKPCAAPCSPHPAAGGAGRLEFKPKGASGPASPTAGRSLRNVIAIVAAGQTPGEADPLAEFTQGRPKALLPLAGRPMVAHVVDALAGSRCVRHVALIALDPAWEVPFAVPVTYVPGAGGLFDNVEAGFLYALERFPDLDAVLYSSSDVPLLTPAIVDAFVEACLRTDHDMYYPVVERTVMEQRFPASRRSYVHLREGDFCGGDMLLLRPTLTVQQRDMLRSLVGARKTALEQARIVGFGLLLKLLLRRLSLAEAERRVAAVLGVRGRVVPFSYAEIGMDVDKPFQLEIARAELEEQAG